MELKIKSVDQLSYKDKLKLQYAFESLEVRKKKKDPQKIINELGVFYKRINTTNTIIDSEGELILKDYIRIYHLNIEWYVRKIKEESKLKKKFYNRGVLLLILIPVTIFILTWLSEDSSPEFFGSLITMFLTIVLALYKATAAWMEKRKFEGLFWKASAELKNRLYEFEDAWENKVNKSNKDEFLENIEGEIREGRKIVNEETQAYFENFSSPILDVPGILSSAHNQSTALFQAFQSTRFKRKLDEESRRLTNELKLEINQKEVAFLEEKQRLQLKELTSIQEQLAKATDQLTIKRLIEAKEKLENAIELTTHEILLKKAEAVKYQ